MLPRLLLCGRNFVSACLIRLDVRFWHKADIRPLQIVKTRSQSVETPSKN